MAFKLIDLDKNELIKTFDTVEDIVDYFKVPKKVIVDGINNHKFFGKNKKILKDFSYDYEYQKSGKIKIRGLNMTEILEALDMQAVEFAKKIGVSKDSVNRWKRGSTSISKRNIKAIEKILERNGIK